MKNERKALLDQPGFQLAVALGGAFAIPALLALFIVVVPGVDISTASTWFFEHDAAQIYFEFAVFGMIPLLLVVLRKDDLGQYGIQRTGPGRSILLSVAFVIIYHLFKFVVYGEWFSHPTLEFSMGLIGKLWHILAGIFAYGPLELFFLIWMIVKIDQMTDSTERSISPGVVVISIVFGMYHIITSGSVENALTVTVIYLSLNLIIKYTNNSIGPMLGWTLINAQVLAYIEQIWQ